MPTKPSRKAPARKAPAKPKVKPKRAAKKAEYLEGQAYEKAALSPLAVCNPFTDTVNKRSWVNVDRTNEAQMFLTRPRKYWIIDAAGAILQSTTAGSRFLMLRAGYHKFETYALPGFKQFAGFTFTSSEIRHIWEMLGRWVATHERHMVRGLEKLYAAELRQMSQDGPAKDPVYTGQEIDDSIIVENTQGVVH